MKNKKIIPLASLMMLSLSLIACGHPEQKFSITVTDEDGKAMEGIECGAGFNRGKKDGPGISPYIVSGTTNAKGKVEISGETVFFDTSVRARKDGYYDSVVEKLWMTGKNDDRWEPWPVEVNLVMKKIQNPKPMYVVKFDGHKWLNFPEKTIGKYGFDLMEGDWITPHGKGKIADFIIDCKKDDPDDSTINPKGITNLTFSNPGDGIIFYEDKGESEMIGPALAPNGNYKEKWDFPNWEKHKTEPGLTSRNFSGEVYIFRIRTKLDENGKVQSSFYGKIDGRIIGRISEKVPSIQMTYYVNGTANDRGLEWDLKNNLIRDTSRMRVPERP